MQGIQHRHHQPGATAALIVAIKRAQQEGRITSKTAQHAINAIRRGMGHHAVWHLIKASMKDRNHNDRRTT